MLWTNFGAEVFPYTTTQSTGAINYVVVSVLQHWIDKYVEQNQLPANLESEDEQIGTVESLIIVAEQAVVYSVLSKDQSAKRLYGVNTARKKFSADVDLGPFENQRILRKQRSNGLFGRYEGPLTSMDVFVDGWENEPHRRVKKDWRKLLDRAFHEDPHQGYSTARDGLFGLFDALIDSAGAPSVSFAQLGDGAVDEMCRLRSLKSVSRIAEDLQYAMQATKDHDEPQRHVWVALGRDEFQEAEDYSPRLVFDRATNGGTSRSKPLRDILDLEAFLGPLEITFHRLWQVSDDVDEDEVVKRCWDKLRGRTSAEKRSLKDLARRPAISHSDTGHRRLFKLSDLIENSVSRRDFVEGLVDYHSEIMEDRDANPWVELNGGDSQPLNEAFNSQEEKDSGDSLEMWGSRDYYLSDFEQFRDDIVQARGGDT